MSDDRNGIDELRERVRWIVAGALVAGILFDRICPALLGIEPPAQSQGVVLRKALLREPLAVAAR